MSLATERLSLALSLRLEISAGGRSITFAIPVSVILAGSISIRMFTSREVSRRVMVTGSVRMNVEERLDGNDWV